MKFAALPMSFLYRLDLQPYVTPKGIQDQPVHFVGAWVARLRGNSAQQMGRFGREPARESVVIFRRA